MKLYIYLSLDIYFSFFIHSKTTTAKKQKNIIGNNIKQQQNPTRGEKLHCYTHPNATHNSVCFNK